MKGMGAWGGPGLGVWLGPVRAYRTLGSDRLEIPYSTRPGGVKSAFLG